MSSRSRKKRMNIDFLGKNEIKITGSTFDIKEDIKKLAKELNLTYKFNEMEDAWLISGEAISDFVKEIQSIAKAHDIETIVKLESEEEEKKKEEVKGLIIHEEALLDRLRSIGFCTRSVGVIYGPPLVGKSRLALRMAMDMARREVEPHIICLLYTSPSPRD